jgi:hypothetical protein
VDSPGPCRRDRPDEVAMTNDLRCGWNTGTARGGPSRCDKPAKARTNHPATNNGVVCGIHARAAGSDRFRPIGVEYTVTALTEE